jgi:hypothetical protein
MEYQSTIDDVHAVVARGLEVLQIAQHPTNQPEKKPLLKVPVIDNEFFRDETVAAVRAELIASVMMQLTKPLEGLITRRNDTRWSWADAGFFDFAKQCSTNVVAALDRLGATSYAIISPTLLTILQAPTPRDFETIVNNEFLPEGTPYAALGMSAVFRNKQHVLFLNAYADDEIPAFCIGADAIQYSGTGLVGLDDDTFWTDVIFTFDESRINLVDIHFPSMLAD